MKNPNFQRNKALQKSYLRHNKWDFNEDRLHVFHCYDNKDPGDKSYWDDFNFVHAKKMVTVWWSHPRKLYMDLCEEITSKDYPAKASDWFSSFNVKNYKKVGKSRKKVVSYSSNAEVDHAYRLATFDFWIKEEEFKLNLHNGIVAAPHIKFEAYEWTTGVDLCYPVEENSAQDLTKLKNIVQSYMREREAGCPLSLPKNTYTSIEYKNEFGTTQLDRAITRKREYIEEYANKTQHSGIRS